MYLSTIRRGVGYAGNLITWIEIGEISEVDVFGLSFKNSKNREYG